MSELDDVELDSPTYKDDALIALEARNGQRINDPRKKGESMNELTPERLAEIKARAAKATPGPWEMVHDDDEQSMNLYAVQRSGGDCVDTEARDLSHVICATLVQSPKTINHDGSSHKWDIDAEFIAAARTDIPDLLAALAAARAENAKLKRDWGLAMDDSQRRINAKDNEIYRLRDVLEAEYRNTLEERAEIARLREALAQYADRSNWGDRRDKTGRVIEDEWIGNEMNGYVVAEAALAPAATPD